MSILGLSAGSHDAAASLVNQDGDILFAGHAERYSGIKNDPDLHPLLMRDVSRYANFDHIDQIAWYERPWLKHTRQIYSGEKALFSKPFNIRQYLNERHFNPKIPITTYSHHLSHAAGGFQTSPFDKAICVVVDAIGEWDCFSVWHAYYSNGYAKYKKIWSRKYPHSLGLYYSAFTERAGLKPNEEEYIMMGMAAYGLKWNWPNVHTGYIKEDSHEQQLCDFNFTLKQNMHTGVQFDHPAANEDIAAAAQHAVEDTLIGLFRQVGRWCSEYDTHNVVYSGGVALNCVANTEISNELLYYEQEKRLWIMPNPGDAGSSLGAAALKYGKKLNWVDPYLGHDLNFNNPREYPVKEAVSELLENQIVGIAHGRAEFGPRALGNRSLFADPRDPDIKDRVNEIKQRQKFRPFAPIIMEEYAHKHFYGLFAQPYTDQQHDNNYMQYTYAMHSDEFPAVQHYDGTARVQTVPKDCKSGVRQLLEQWYFWSGGCPMLLNTSLNIRGEPMVNTREDADRFETTYGVKVCS